MLLPLLLIAFATGAAAVLAYGVHPAWGRFEFGLELIVWSRRLQWPLAALSIVLCLVLIGLVIAGRRRAWWLIGLGPILALFVHHFAPFARDRAGALRVLDDPPLAAVADVAGRAPGKAGALADDDWVVGVRFGDTSYAYPYAALFRAPVVLQTDHDRRMVLLWSAWANRALAFRLTAPVRGRDLEVVSTPANAVLVYDARRGQFINGLKGLTTDDRPPAGFGAPLATVKATWKQWRADNPTGKVMTWSPDAAAVAGGSTASLAPTQPILPAWPMPGGSADGTGAARRRATLVGWPQPAAVVRSLVGDVPVNVPVSATAGGATTGGGTVLLYRPNPAANPLAFAAPASPAGAEGSAYFVRARPDARRSEAAFRETAGGTLWTATGAGVAHTPSAGSHLKPVPVDDDVDWAVIHCWYPGLRLMGADGRAE